MDRLSAALKALVRKAVPELPFAGIYQYSVTACDVAAQTLDARSLDSSVPDLTRVPMASPGAILDVPFGTLIQVGFRNLDQSSPYVASYSSGGSSKIKNVVDLGWIGLSQALPTASTLTVVMVPAGTLPPPDPVAEPGVPTVLTPVPIYFALTGVVTDGS